MNMAIMIASRPAASHRITRPGRLSIRAAEHLVGRESHKASANTEIQATRAPQPHPFLRAPDLVRRLFLHDYRSRQRKSRRRVAVAIPVTNQQWSAPESGMIRRTGQNPRFVHSHLNCPMDIQPRGKLSYLRHDVREQV
ncbi:MAG: hypothetical protein ACRDN0_13335, partial [Trebonia sp.]